MNRWFCAAALVLSATVVACGEDAGDGAVSSNVDAAAVDGGALSDAIAAADAAPADVATAVDSSGTEKADIAAEDGGGSDSGGLCQTVGEFGCPCQQNSDCDSSFCLESAGGKVCSKTCVDECPAGYACKSVTAGGGDVVSLCVPPNARRCDPGETDADCNGPLGAGGAICRDYSDGGALVGRFCATACAGQSDCPAGYTCAPHEDGKTSHCALQKAICSCSKRAIDNGLKTSCTTKTAAGSCTGARVCTDKGLSACDAPSAASETCDGIDNDCDGQVDAPAAGLCNDANPCTVDSCNGGKCAHINADVGCDDGNACTEKDSCDKGKCGGLALSCDDNNPCTDDKCDPKSGCGALPNAASCDDGDVCSLADKCKDGACLPGAATVCDDGNLCTDDACAPTSGCTFVANTLPCDDGNACTAADTCAGAQCGGAAVACDDGNPCTDDACLPSSGCTVTVNVASCSDGNVCTEADACAAGTCQPGPSKVCDDGKLCTDDQCDPKKGCVTVANKLPCDDGSICTSGDVCAAGSCQSGAAVLCNDGNVCTDDSCDAKAGCVFAPNQASCTDNNACTQPDRCAKGACAPGKAVGCDDGNVCTDDACDPQGGCTKTPNAGACVDGSVCTLGDACVAGKCVAGKPQACDDGNGCTDDSCDPTTGCKHKPNNASCTDNNACTVTDRCVKGACAPGAAKKCDDGKVCTDDSCDPKSGCASAANKAACNDGNACTTGDICAAGQCTGKGQLACSDANPCTDDSCDPKSGCQHKPNAAPCSDNNKCTVGDACKAGVCAPKAPSKCDDGNLCTTESCDPIKGCSKVDNTAPCNDGSVCTVGDACKAGVCAAGVSQGCNDGNVCTDDSCDAKAGCQHKPNAASCSDNNKCTVQDGCAKGRCQPGKALICNDANPCTNDFCDPIKGCLKANNTAPCDDGSVCTVGDTCASGACTPGKKLTCNDGNVCTDDSCHPKLGCAQANNSKPCPDADKCTAKETCSNGQCVKATTNCDDNNPCTLDTCDSAKGCQKATLQNGVVCSLDGSKICQAGQCVSACPKTFVGVVHDGSVSAGTDLRYQYSPVSAGKGVVRANWGKQGKGVLGYEVAVGTTKGGTQVSGYKSVGLVQGAAVTGLSLKGAWTGAQYFVSVRGVCPGGQRTPAASSNGVKIAEKALFDGATSGLRAPDSKGGYTNNWPANGHHAIYGAHYFETVHIKSGSVVKVQGWGRAQKVGQGISVGATAVKSPADGWLGLYANKIIIEGTITASGRGYGGGGAGGGGSNSVGRQGLGGSNGLGGNGGNGEGNSGGGGGGSPYGKGGSGGQGAGGSGNMLGAGSGSTTCGGRAGRNGGDGPVSDIGRTGGTASSGKVGPGGAGEFSRGGGNGVHACDSWSGGGGGGYGAGGGGGTQWQGPGTDSGGGGGGGTGGGGGGHSAHGAKGAGPHAGGGGSANASHGGDGGYRSAGSNGDKSTDRSVFLGSGGGGGGAGSQEAGGGGGSAGGGAIILHAVTSLQLGKTARLLANGAGAGGGGRDNGGNATGRRGGRGAGGGILLESGALTFVSGAHVSCRGGDGRTANGGTLKLFYGALSGLVPSKARVGRLYNAGKGSYKIQ